MTVGTNWERTDDSRAASYEQQHRWIPQATDAVETAARVRPVVFRTPNLSIGETTLRALEHEGYRYDSSVPARRFDMGFGRVHYTKYFWAPPEPYNPPINNCIFQAEAAFWKFLRRLVSFRSISPPCACWACQRSSA